MPERIISFIEKNAEFAPDADGVFGCVDGRPPKSPLKHRPFGVPGGALGFALAALKAYPGMSARKALDYVRETTGLTCHTDDHSDSRLMGSCPCAGCGHLVSAISQRESYGLTPETEAFFKRGFFKYLREHNVNPVVLTGEHGEGAVVIVDDGIRLPDVRSGDPQFFAFYPGKAREGMFEVAQAVAVGEGIEDVAAFQEKCLKALEGQLELTLITLNAKRKSVIQVTRNSDKIKVTLKQ